MNCQVFQLCSRFHQKDPIYYLVYLCSLKILNMCPVHGDGPLRKRTKSCAYFTWVKSLKRWCRQYIVRVGVPLNFPHLSMLQITLLLFRDWSLWELNMGFICQSDCAGTRFEGTACQGGKGNGRKYTFSLTGTFVELVKWLVGRLVQLFTGKWTY